MGSIYRKNKYDEWVEVYKYECGTCKNYEFEREDVDNYCVHYRKCYPYRDSCRDHWKESDKLSTGCFLTTACCTYKGLPDDCYELQALRKFRDTVLKKTETGTALVQLYYEQAPKIVERIDRLSEEKRDAILNWLYQEISQVAALIEEDVEKHFDEIVTRYVMVTIHAEQKLSAEE